MLVLGLGSWSIGLVILKLHLLGLVPRFRLHDILILLLNFHGGTQDLSLQPWTFCLEAGRTGPALFLMTYSYCFWTCMLKHWTCHISIEMIIRRLSFNLNHMSLLFLDSHVGALYLSLEEAEYDASTKCR